MVNRTEISIEGALFFILLILLTIKTYQKKWQQLNMTER